MAGIPIGTRAVTWTQCPEPQPSDTDSRRTRSGSASCAACSGSGQHGCARPSRAAALTGGHCGDGEKALNENMVAGTRIGTKPMRNQYQGHLAPHDAGMDPATSGMSETGRSGGL